MKNMLTSTAFSRPGRGVVALAAMLALAVAGPLAAQPVVSDLEDLGLAPNTFQNNAGSAGAFFSGNIALPNSYDSQFDFWSGWAVSSIADNQTPGFTNQYGVIDGGGAEGSATFAVGYAFDVLVLRLTGASAGRRVLGVSISNSTYAYYSMRDGDAFAKKFGGISGNDPDFFRLTVRKYLGGELSADSIDFYLADYRFADNNQDYLIDEWTFLDLSTLGEADSLAFVLNSSDVGAFGMNTPAYFCLDRVVTEAVTSTQDALGQPSLTVFPNPVAETLYFTAPEAGEARLLDALGRQVARQRVAPGAAEIPVQGLPAGRYTLVLAGERSIRQAAVLKQ
jgi:hypothetical protein